MHWYKFFQRLKWNIAFNFYVGYNLTGKISILYLLKRVKKRRKTNEQKTKALAALAACTLMLGSVGFTASAAGNDVTVDGNSMYNDYIKILCDSDGSLRMRTTNGDPDNPNDNDKKLLFGTSSGTSHTLINVDGESNQFDYISDSNMVFEFDSANKTHLTSKKYNGIDIRQNYTFVKSNATDRYDMLEIK